MEKLKICKPQYTLLTTGSRNASNNSVKRNEKLGFMINKDKTKLMVIVRVGSFTDRLTVPVRERGEMNLSAWIVLSK